MRTSKTEVRSTTDGKGTELVTVDFDDKTGEVISSRGSSSGARFDRPFGTQKAIDDEVRRYKKNPSNARAYRAGGSASGSPGISVGRLFISVIGAILLLILGAIGLFIFLALRSGVSVTF